MKKFRITDKADRSYEKIVKAETKLAAQIWVKEFCSFYSDKIIKRIKPKTIEEYLEEKGWQYEQNIIALYSHANIPWSHVYQKDNISIFSMASLNYGGYIKSVNYENYFTTLNSLKTALKEIKAQQKADIYKTETTEFDFVEYMIDKGFERRFDRDGDVILYINNITIPVNQRLCSFKLNKCNADIWIKIANINNELEKVEDENN